MTFKIYRTNFYCFSLQKSIVHVLTKKMSRALFNEFILSTLVDRVVLNMIISEAVLLIKKRSAYFQQNKKSLTHFLSEWFASRVIVIGKCFYRVFQFLNVEHYGVT